jgi:hypothetical protein
MPAAEPEHAYLAELRAFLDFLKNLWGLLAGVSVFFPLSNILLGAIPMRAYVDDGVFDQLAPALITTLATVVVLFVVLVTFIGRRRFAAAAQRRRILRDAWVSFGVSMLSLLGYLVIHTVYREYAWEPWGWGSGDPRKLLAEIPLLITYGIFFALLTRAFMLLGMIEYFSSGGDRHQP